MLVRHLRRANHDDANLDSWLDGLDEDSRKALEEVVRLVPDRGEIPLKDFCEWLPEASKYLFHRDD